VTPRSGRLVDWLRPVTPSGLGSISQEQSNGSFADGQFGTEDADLTWTMRVHIPVIIDDVGTNRARFGKVRGNGNAVDFEVDGTVEKDPLAGCEFGSACPSPSAPHNQPCESDLFEEPEWVEGPAAGGHPEAVTANGRLLAVAV